MQRQEGLKLEAAHFTTSLSNSITHLETLYYWRRVFEYWKEADIFYLNESMVTGSKTKEMTCIERKARLQIFVREMGNPEFSSGKMPKKLHPIVMKGKDGKDLCNVQAYQLPLGPQVGQFIGYHSDAFALLEELESIMDALEETLGKHDKHTGLCATKSLLDMWNSDVDVKHSCILPNLKPGRNSSLHDSSCYGEPGFPF
jgi:hypothetical protein